MGKVNKITKEKVIEVLTYIEKFGDKITNLEIAKLTGIGESTVGKILSGSYDYLLNEPEVTQDDSYRIDASNQLSTISERLHKLSNDMESDNSEIIDMLEQVDKELKSIGDLLHIIAVFLMRTEKNPSFKSKMASQIQAVHSNERISKALK